MLHQIIIKENNTSNVIVCLCDAVRSICDDGENMLVVFFCHYNLSVTTKTHKYSCRVFFPPKSLTLIGQINFVGAESHISFD